MPFVYYRKLIKHGGSLVVSIPKHLPRLWGLKAGDWVAVEHGHANTARIYPPKGENRDQDYLPKRVYIPDQRTPGTTQWVHRPRKARRARKKP